MREAKIVEKQVTRQVVEYGSLSCDLCGFDEDESYVWTFVLGIDPDGCAGTRITRDVCQDCYEDKLASLTDPLLVVLKAGDDKLQEAHDDRYYG